MKKYYYKLLTRYLHLYCFPNNNFLEINPPNTLIQSSLNSYLKYSSLKIEVELGQKNSNKPILGGLGASFKKIKNKKSTLGTKKDVVDYVFLNGTIHTIENIYVLFQKLTALADHSTRFLIVSYSLLWKPLITLGIFLRVPFSHKLINWVSTNDVKNFIHISGYEILHEEKKILCPLYIPILSNFLNTYIAPLPFIRHLCLINIYIARIEPNIKTNTISTGSKSLKPSVSIIVPARNEAGNIKNIIERVPKMSAKDELIFVEGNSRDNTWEVIQEMSKKYQKEKNISYYKQTGKGKGDAVRLGFSKARGDILMILDADLTVEPEQLPYFYELIVSGKGEFINGSRLVYKMAEGAMQFFNIIGNTFFAKAFSFTLGQKFKDTLCGTKVLSRKNYLKLAEHRGYFGEIDPFGDFDLLFGAARMNLKIVEYPTPYKERVYGTTNISRWRHGFILLHMLIKASLKIKFI